MRIEELMSLLDSFRQEANTNNPKVLEHYKIEVNFNHVDGTQHVELYSYLRNRKLIRSTLLEEYDIEDLIWTTSRTAQPLRRNEWFLNWRKTLRREYILKELGI
jgi:hypothetical protein